MMTLETPAILFGAITLILLAQTNRFFSLASLVRDIHAHKTGENSELEQKQIPTLKKRLVLTKYMQAFGVLSFILCTGSALCIFFEMETGGGICFLVSILLILISLLLSLWEILISTKALEMVLEDC